MTYTTTNSSLSLSVLDGYNVLPIKKHIWNNVVHVEGVLWLKNVKSINQVWYIKSKSQASNNTSRLEYIPLLATAPLTATLPTELCHQERWRRPSRCSTTPLGSQFVQGSSWPTPSTSYRGSGSRWGSRWLVQQGVGMCFVPLSLSSTSSLPFMQYIYRGRKALLKSSVNQIGGEEPV